MRDKTQLRDNPLIHLVRTDRDGSTFCYEYSLMELDKLGEDVRAHANTTGVARLEIIIPSATEG